MKIAVFSHEFIWKSTDFFSAFFSFFVWGFAWALNVIMRLIFMNLEIQNVNQIFGWLQREPSRMAKSNNKTKNKQKPIKHTHKAENIHCLPFKCCLILQWRNEFFIAHSFFKCGKRWPWRISGISRCREMNKVKFDFFSAFFSAFDFFILFFHFQFVFFFSFRSHLLLFNFNLSFCFCSFLSASLVARPNRFIDLFYSQILLFSIILFFEWSRRWRTKFVNEKRMENVEK